MIPISVILTAYNEGKYLEEMFGCILSQTFRDFELIAVDDGSTDNTGEIMDAYAPRFEGRARVIHQENQGISATRNNGLSVATGEYIAFLDGDDIITPDYLERLYSAAKVNNSDISKCSFEDFAPDGEKSGYISAKARNIEYSPGKHYLFQYSPWAGLLKREFIEKYNIRFSVGEHMEDSPFALITNQLAESFVVVDDLVYHHRLHKGSIMANVAEAIINPRIPYRGFENAVKLVRKNTGKDFRDFSDYCFVRVLTDYSTLRYDTQGSAIRHELIDYMYRIMDGYFPDFTGNPYLSLNKLKEIPLFERIAVRMFAKSYKHRMLYAFSTCVSVALRLKK